MTASFTEGLSGVRRWPKTGNEAKRNSSRSVKTRMNLFLIEIASNALWPPNA
jgi:hypothetical protein